MPETGPALRPYLLTCALLRSAQCLLCRVSDFSFGLKLCWSKHLEKKANLLEFEGSLGKSSGLARVGAGVGVGHVVKLSRLSLLEWEFLSLEGGVEGFRMLVLVLERGQDQTAAKDKTPMQESAERMWANCFECGGSFALSVDMHGGGEVFV